MQAKLHFQPSTFVLNTNWDILKIWSKKNEQNSELIKKPKQTSQALLIYRDHEQVYCKPLEQVAFQILSAIRTGKSLEEIFPSLSNEFESLDPYLISQWFSQWVYLGIFSNSLS